MRLEDLRDFTRADWQAAGLVGWVPFAALATAATSPAPDSSGIYAVVRPAEDAPAFLDRSPAGWFKGRDPSVERERLVREWLPGVETVYIGRARRLRRRLASFARFGAGAPVAHWGGRLIWQLANPDTMRVGWIETQEAAHRGLEKALISAFSDRHGARPFANLVG